MPDALRRKLEILADAAKYDASCASSAAPKRDSRDGGLGSTEGMGICHAHTPDGRCVSLLKVLLTNACVFDCAYCINRASSNVPRARFTVEELVALTLDFYRRNCIEGLFLSSGIIRSPDYTMEQMVRVARSLREEHLFRGYIHLKTIPDAAPELLAEAGRYADRLSINVELPQAESLARLAPEKHLPSIRRSMGRLAERIAEGKERGAPRFAPAGQSTQMIVGADGADDRAILAASQTLYKAHALKRVYYSAYSPIPDASAALPARAAPLVREHRLYQSDWLLQSYGFALDEIVPAGEGAMLDLEADPKLAWALRNRHLFPVELNRAAREMLLRVPGLGLRNVERILKARQVKAIRTDDLARMRLPMRRLRPFVTVADATPGALLDRLDLRSLVLPGTAFAAQAAPRQLVLL
jgi:putative DNA modification/repair radical SAM protein